MGISLTAGSPKCSCKNPDTCTHAIKIKTSSPEGSYEYKQGESLPVIYLHDAEAKGVDFKTTLIGKTCVSNSPDCPSGVIHNDYYLSQLVKGENSNTLKYYSSEDKVKLTMGSVSTDKVEKLGVQNVYSALDSLDIVTFLSDILFKGLENVDRTEYQLQIGECLGQPVQEFIYPLKTAVDGKAKLPIYTSVDTRIVVFPKFAWSVNVNISSSENDGTKELSDDERYKIVQSRENNSSMSVGKYSITHGVHISGSGSISVGSSSKDYSKTMDKEFTRYKDKLTLLRNADKTLDTVTNLLKADDDKIQLLKIDIKYPFLDITGSGDLHLRKNNTPYVKCAADVKLSPLIEFTITLDLIQAFATYFHQEKNIAKIREKAQSKEGDVKAGKNGVYAKAVLNLVVSGNINLSYRYLSDENYDFHSELGNENEGQLGLALESKVEAGLKILIVEAYFSAEAKITAECCFALEKKDDKDLELVFFHNGIAMYAKYRIKVSVGDEDDDNDPDMSKKKIDDSDNWEEGEGEWVICHKLNKEKSPYRIVF
ncbi:hypothetical protein AB1E22_18570 [Buttiauxella gaviniae]|uniref:Thiol-activated cytolysin n=1 Tax=Buttiauxella gaviniae TaxID=82990 RepID=A0ABV3NYP9_9ENTR